MQTETNGKQIHETIKRLVVVDGDGMTADEVQICRLVISVISKQLSEAVKKDPSTLLKTLDKGEIEGFIIFHLFKTYSESETIICVENAQTSGQA